MVGSIDDGTHKLLCLLMYLCRYKCIYIALTFVCFFLFFLYKTTPEFVSTPTSVNATLGSTATFNCNATTGSVGWIVNGSFLSHQITPDIRAIGIGTTSSLHVPAIEKYNNMNVTCIVFTLSNNLRSGPVVLRIQGMHSEQVFQAYIVETWRRIFQSPFVQSTQYLPRLLYTQTQQVLGAV